jgi:hypothetical protein
VKNGPDQSTHTYSKLFGGMLELSLFRRQEPDANQLGTATDARGIHTTLAFGSTFYIA